MTDYNKHDEPEDIVKRMVELATAKGWTVNQVEISRQEGDSLTVSSIKGRVVPHSGGALVADRVAQQQKETEQ
ncbi:MAG: hypothetical protein CMP20_04100 [Rickettsiales bacterium]|nr:hypothetical protein [Rickettsiales bacterium]